MIRQLRFFSLLSFAIVLVLSGCGGGKPASGSKAAIFPDSDLVVSVDMKALSDAPVMSDLTGEAGEKSTLFSLLMNEFDAQTVAKVKESLAIEDEDLHKLTLSMKLDNLNLDAPSPGELAMVVGFDFAKEMTNEKLKNAFGAVVDEQGGSLTESGDFLVAQPPEGSNDQPVYLCAEGTTVFAGSKDALLKDAVKRKQSQSVTMPDAVAALEKMVEKDAQGMFLIALPDSMQKQLKEKIGQSQGTGSSLPPQMQAALQPFQSLKTIVGTVKAADTLKLNLVFELGSEADAKGAATPVMQLIRMLGMFAPPLAVKNITPQVQGASLSIPIELTKEDLKSLQQAGAGMQGMPGSGTGSTPPPPVGG